MTTSRTKFVLLFVIGAFVFLFVTNSFLDQAPESLFGNDSQPLWQNIVSKIISPIKVVLIGPLLPFINFLRQDPDTPPPFYLIGFAMYWTVLGMLVHYILSRKKAVR